MFILPTIERHSGLLETFHSIVVAPKESPSTFRKIYRLNRGEEEGKNNKKLFFLYVALALCCTGMKNYGHFN